MAELQPDTAAVLRWALWYAGRGWPVFPCKGKRPPKGLAWRDEATSDPDKIRAWWAEYPEANVAIAVPAGLVILDVDMHGRDGLAALKALEAEHEELPDTLMAKTGSGGIHVWLRLPEGVEHGNARGKLDKAFFDVRGHGGYVIAAPSVHPDTGHCYVWEGGSRGVETPIAPIPDWLLAIMKGGKEPARHATVLPFSRPDERVRTLKRASAYLEKLDPAIAGSGGHDTTWEAACAMVRGFGLSEGEAYGLLASEYNDRCRPPWSEADLRHKVSGAAGDSSRPWGYLLTAGLPAQVRARVRATRPEEGQAHRDGEGEGEGEGGDEERDELPEIDVGNRQLRDLISEAWDALHLANDPPSIFRRGGTLAQVAPDEEHGPVVRSMCLDSVHGHLARVADWVVWIEGKDGPQRKNARASKDIARDLLVYTREDLPELEGVAFAPTFDRTGRLVTEAGYDAGAKTWLHLADTLKVEPVPEEPTADDVAAALALLRDDVLVDFPLVGESDWAHALAMLLLPYMRQLVSGPTPLHLVEATGPGSGKGLLTEVVYELAMGAPLVATTLPSTDDEIAKMLLAELLKAQPIVTLDNASERIVIRSPSLASTVASTRTTGRHLGHSSMITVKNRAMWILTGNNPSMSLEIARRCIRIRIAPKQDRPWLREGFKHDPLLGWVRSERSAIVRACLVLIQAWVAAGQPPGKQRLGSFEGWAQAMGGLLDTVGVPGFLTGLEDLYEAADVDGNAWREFAAAWTDQRGEAWQSCRDLRILATELELLAHVLGDKGERSQQTRLGKALKRMEGRIFGDRQLTSKKDKRSKSALYRLARVGEADEPAPGETCPIFDGEW